MNGMISNTPDVANIRVNEDARAAAMQISREADVEQEAEEHVNQVRTKDDADGPESESDASGGSRNEYAGDGGARRRKNKDSFGKVVKKQPGGFNISI